MNGPTLEIQNALRILTKHLQRGQSVTITGGSGDLVACAQNEATGRAQLMRTQDAAPLLGLPRFFVFLSSMSQPFMVKEWGGKLWVFRWNENDSQWVSGREVASENELVQMHAGALPEELARVYHERHHERTGSSVYSS